MRNDPGVPGGISDLAACRPDKFDVLDKQVAIARRVEVVQVRQGKLLLTRTGVELHIVISRLPFAGGNFDHLQLLVPQLDRQLGQFRPRLLAERMHAQDILTSAGEVDGRGGPAFAEKPHDAFVDPHVLTFAEWLERLARHRRARDQRGRIRDDGDGHDLFRSRQILLEQHRRQREDIADVVEAVAHFIQREICGRLEVHAHQVTDGIVELRAVEAADGDAPGVHRPIAVKLRKLLLNEEHQLLAIRLARLGLLFGRHLARLQHVAHGFPDLSVLEHPGCFAEALEVQVAFVFGLVVAIIAIGRHEGLHVLAVVDLLEAGRQWSRLCGLTDQPEPGQSRS